MNSSERYHSSTSISFSLFNRKIIPYQKIKMAVIETIDSLHKTAFEMSASEVHIKSIKPTHLRLSGRPESVEMDLKGIFHASAPILA
jgi:hypothetical protein